MCEQCDKRQRGFKNMVINGFSNKISATGFVGVIFCFGGLFLFALTVIGYFFGIGDSGIMMAILDKILILIGTGSALLGVRKFSNSKINANNVPQQISDPITNKEQQEPLNS